MKSGSGYVERLRRTWYLRSYVVDAATGHRKQKRTNLGADSAIRSREHARKVADEWLARQSPSTLQAGPRVRFVEFSEWYLVQHVAGLRPSSRRRYRSAIQSLQRELGAELVCNIDAARLKHAVNNLAQRMAHASVRFTRAIALAMLRLARDSGYGAHIVQARDVPMPRNAAPERERPSFTRSQLDQILETSVGQWRVLWAVMAFAGLRCGEALALEWRDVDLIAGVILVRRALTRAGIGATKTAASAASVPILPDLARVLADFRETDQRDGLLFVNGRGRALDPDNTRHRRLRPMLAQLGLTSAGMHAFRHTTLRLLMDLGLGTELARRFMRHSSLAVTARYMHSNDKDLRAAIDAATRRQSLFRSEMAAP